MKTMQLSLVYETFATNFLFIPASFALLNDMLARTVFTSFHMDWICRDSSEVSYS